MQKQREAEVANRRTRLESCKQNYTHYTDGTLRQVVKFNTIKASSLTSDLADGTAAKAWKHSGDLSESLAQIASQRDDLLLVAEAVQELLDERQASATTREP